MLNSMGLNKSPQETTVCVAMSGGVDSSAAAAMLKKEGYNVFGVTMDLLRTPYAPTKSSIADAAKVAEQLQIPHQFIDLKQEFAQKVVDYFTNSYLLGLTPSPCIMCNKHIKLGLLADYARKQGADIIVTGHYADIRLTQNGVELHRAEDLSRDQSYFLFGISKQNLQMLRCPLATYSKEQTRAIAKEAGLEIHQKADSQDICFVQNGKYADLINKLRPDFNTKPGDIVDTSGKILGRHKGIINYTIGQRRGLGIGGDIGIVYVLKIDALNNQIIVGSKEELLQKRLHIKDINWLGEEQPQEMDLRVKLRSRQASVSATVYFDKNNGAEISLHDDFYGIAPGQGCCFYQGSRVLGGGIISPF